jgi:hypothetical protein
VSLARGPGSIAIAVRKRRADKQVVGPVSRHIATSECSAEIVGLALPDDPNVGDSANALAPAPGASTTENDIDLASIRPEAVGCIGKVVTNQQVIDSITIEITVTHPNTGPLRDLGPGPDRAGRCRGEIDFRAGRKRRDR